MRLQGHIAGSILFCGILLYTIEPSDEIADRLMAIAIISGSLPDWDYVYYVLKRRSVMLGNDFRHHTWITHTFPIYIIPAVLLYIFGNYISSYELQLSAIVFGLSTCIHLIQDMFGTGDGIMVFYPFSRKMFGWELSGKHGKEWLEQYPKSRTYHLEHLITACGLFYISYYIGYRIGGLAKILSIFYLTVIIIYIALIIFTFLILLKQVEINWHIKGSKYFHHVLQQALF